MTARTMLCETVVTISIFENKLTSRMRLKLQTITEERNKGSHVPLARTWVIKSLAYWANREKNNPHCMFT